MERIQIGIFGKTNTGKSSLMNFLVDQEIAIVSPQAGTTTDSVKKIIELAPLGAVQLIDTAGVEEKGELGSLREKATQKELTKIDLALFLFCEVPFSVSELELVEQFQHYHIPFLLIYQKSDLKSPTEEEKLFLTNITSQWKGCGGWLPFSVRQATDHERNELLRKLSLLLPDSEEQPILEQLLSPQDHLLLVTPIDQETPKKRLILPQVQLIREALENHCLVSLIQPTELPLWLNTVGENNPPALIVVDSQLFAEVAPLIPQTIPLTSFSILLALQKGPFDLYLKGTPFIDQLKEGDHLLILESCSHTVSCEDIGRVKLPALLKKRTGKNLNFTVIPASETLPTPLEKYSMIVQCGGCMSSNRELKNRLAPAIAKHIPLANYGMVFAFCSNLFERATAPFLNNKKERLLK